MRGKKLPTVRKSFYKIGSVTKSRVVGAEEWCTVMKKHCDRHPTAETFPKVAFFGRSWNVFGESDMTPYESDSE